MYKINNESVIHFRQFISVKVKKMLRKSQAQFAKLNAFIGQKSMFRHYCIQNVEGGTHISVYKINNESVIHFRQYILVKVKKNSRKSQAQFAKLKVFIGQNSMFRHYCIQNVEDGTHI